MLTCDLRAGNSKFNTALSYFLCSQTFSITIKSFKFIFSRAYSVEWSFRKVFFKMHYCSSYVCLSIQPLTLRFSEKCLTCGFMYLTRVVDPQFWEFPSSLLILMKLFESNTDASPRPSEIRILMKCRAHNISLIWKPSTIGFS